MTLHFPDLTDVLAILVGGSIGAVITIWYSRHHSSKPKK